MDDRAQTAVEYLLLIGAGILVVLTVAALIRTTILAPALSTAENQSATYRNLTNISGP